MADRYPWQDSYSIGVLEIDEQHKGFLVMLNALRESMDSGDDKEMVDKTLDGLVNYTHTHFEFEEREMRGCGYPDCVRHKKIHDAFKSQAIDLYSEVFEGRTVLTIEVVSKMVNWLVNHIIKEDKLIASHLARCKSA